MSQNRLLAGAYGLIALIALVLTWSQNLAYFGGPNPLAAFPAFLTDAAVNPASRSVTFGIALVFYALAVWMVVEAKRRSIGHVWVYVIAGLLVDQRHPAAVPGRAGTEGRPRDAWPTWVAGGSRPGGPGRPDGGALRLRPGCVGLAAGQGVQIVQLVRHAGGGVHGVAAKDVVVALGGVALVQVQLLLLDTALLGDVGVVEIPWSASGRPSSRP